MLQERTSRRLLIDSPSTRVVWSLALPVVGQNFLAMLVGWSDAILAGRILVESRYLAAGIVAGYLLWLMENVSSLIGSGSQAIVSRMIGAGDHRSADRVTAQSLTMAAALGLVLGIATYQFADDAARWMNLEESAQALTAQYLQIVAFSGPMMTVMLVGTTCLRAAGETMSGMYILVVVNVINVVFSWLLTVGCGPIPAMGWAGIATGTSASFIAGGMATVAWLIAGRSSLRLHPADLRPSRDVAARILRIGVPGCANSMTVVLSQLWFLSIIGRLGTTATAAHAVAIRCESISWLTAEAFSVAAATLVGQSLGALRPDLARQHGWTALGWGTTVLIAMGVLFFTQAAEMFALIVSPTESNVAALGVPVLRLVSFAMPALAASVILTGALRGAGDTRGPLLYNFLGLFGFRIPLALWLTSPAVGWGLWGAWAAMFVDLQFRGVCSAGWFLASKWTRIRV
jgi:putative MATE family efflux protein